jgi:chaperonin GroES
MNANANPKFVPLFERVLVLPDAVETKTQSGIVLAVESRKRPNTGTVVSVGHLVAANSACPIKIGDRILYQRYSGLNVKVDEVDHHLIMANDMLAILNDDKITFELREP